MKIKKHKVNYIYKSKGKFVFSLLRATKEDALKFIGESVREGRILASYGGEVEIDLVCEGCGKDLKVGDDYIRLEDDERYCSDCYEEETITHYTVGGEFVGDDNNVAHFGDWHGKDVYNY